MKRMKVCVITGTRAEFGIWTSVLHAVQKSSRLQLQLVVTGMHLQREFGYTVKDIEAAGFKIAAKVPMYHKRQSASENLATGIRGLGKTFRQLCPNLVMLLGDRLEMLAAGCAALAEQIPIAHVHGGETAPGQWDEQIRHALTKMAHVHFCATKKAGERILRMGEVNANVHVVGAPSLDLAYTLAKATRKLMMEKKINLLKLGGRSPLVLLHPSSADERVEHHQALMVLDTLRKIFPDRKLIAIGPNNDPGHEGILRAYRERAEDVLLQMSVPQGGFWAMLMGSGLLVGNSSSGIIEAATFEVPVVNVGERQAGRERSANVIDVAWKPKAIERAIRRAMSDRHFLRKVAKLRNVYGDGHAAERIARVLENMSGEKIAVAKRFRD